jgi:membrane protease subunit HflK
MPEGQNGGGRGPWGQGPQGGGQGGGAGPDLEELLRRGQDRFRQARRRGGGGGGRGGLGGQFGNMGTGGLIVIALIILGAWIATGVYQVDAGEEGVVMRFGAYERSEAPGLHIHMPWPIEAHYTPNVQQERRVNVGFTETGERRAGNLAEESLMLTGDENIIDISFTVLWNIKNAPDFLFNVQDPEGAVRAAAESGLREVVGQNELQTLLTRDRGPVEARVQEIMQDILDEYGAGVSINRVNLQNVLPPRAVQDAFDDVQSAEQDEVRFRNEATRDARTMIEQAGGQADQIIQQAEAYREQTIAQAQGEAQRFIAIYNEYAEAPDVTRRRMYLETMERVMGDMDKIIIDDGAGGVVPYLPLNELQGRPSGTSSAATNSN